MRNSIFCLFAAVALITSGLVSCVKINEELGDNFIPTEQIWNVFPCDDVALSNITMAKSDKLSGYSTSRITFGSIKDGQFSSMRSSSFTLVPLLDTLDFGTETEVLQFHFTAARDTVCTLKNSDLRILQNVYAYALNEPLDSTILYTSDFSDQALFNRFVNTSRTITSGIPVYNGGDSLSFDFSKEYAQQVIDGIKEWQKMDAEKRDSLSSYLEKVPGIYITTDQQTTDGGRINMIELPMQASDGYIDANYAELKIRAKYNGSTEPTDTLFVFYFGPSEFLKDGATSYPAQYAFNTSEDSAGQQFIEDWENGNKDAIYVEGGSGYKPVVKASEIKAIVDELIRTEAPGVDANSVVINKATIFLPFNVGTSYDVLDRYPTMLSPTVRLVSEDDKYITYAGLTDSSIETENQGNINRSLMTYSPDISHHVQEIAKLTQEEGESDDDFKKRLEKYDIWFLIMHEEVVKQSSSSNSSYDDYYNSLMYNSYYNNMMYDPYGYGYGYGGYGGYGYGGYGYGYGDYGYNNYYNYYMMAAYANASSSSSTTSSSIELDRDRFYDARLYGPGSSEKKPSLRITFSAPKKLEE